MGSRHLHTHSDFNNFVAKFCQLWQAGITANLHVETHAGMAWCQVREQLGRAPAPAHRRPQAQRQQPGPRRRGPAHQRRKARRAADRAAATKAAEDAAREKAAEEAAIKRAAEEAAANKAAEGWFKN